jgi:glutathione S-transferase
LRSRVTDVEGARALKLYSHPVSPFARKCRVIAHELGLKLEIVNVEAR